MVKSFQFISISDCRFSLVCEIHPERTNSGEICKIMPQHRYDNIRNLPLNNYGKGPFCKFKVPNDYNFCGVYVIFVDGSPKYVGECQNLSNRFNMGYGNISTRNCFVGGQETNCRINNLIFQETKKGSFVVLWFHQTEDHKAIELNLRNHIKFEWNKT